MSPSTHSLFPIPLEPRISVPTPMISTIEPYSLFIGAKSNSSASVAALMNFIVTISVRNSAIPASAAALSSGAGVFAPRAIAMHGIAREQSE